MQFRFGGFVLDDEGIRLTCDGRVVSLRPKVFDLLVLLVRERDRVVLREEIVAKLWSSTAVGTGSLSGLVNELRAALGEDGRGPSSIRTVHARGYQFVAPVERLQASGGVDAVAFDGAPDGSGDAVLERAAWERALRETPRAGARAVVAALPEAASRRTWLLRAMREAERAGFAVRGSSGGEERFDPEAAAARVERMDCDERTAARGERGSPIALAVEIAMEEAAGWAQAGGLVRLLDLLGSSPVLVVAAVGGSRGGLAGEWARLGLDDPRIDVVSAGSPSRDGGTGRERFRGMRELLDVLARIDGAGFVAALDAMGFEPVRDGPIRSMRRVAPGGHARDDHPSGLEGLARDDAREVEVG